MAMQSRKICVIGMGYIGLPTATMFANHGFEVLGVDTNLKLIETLASGKMHIDEPGLGKLFDRATSCGDLKFDCMPHPADAFIIAVPTPIKPDKTADMSAVVSATESVAPCLGKGNLVLLESTSPPNTTLELVKPILGRHGLTAGRDFSLAYSPERVLPGQILKELVENARVVGGIDRKSAEAARNLYAAFVKGEIILTGATTAEMVKLMENTYRDVNIALANEFALIAERLGLDVWEAIEIANHHPRVNILRPGPGVGGHCIAVDPWFLVEKARDQANLIRQARMNNDSMPEHVIARAAAALRGIDSPTIACLGATFKADVGDIRESPAAEIINGLVHANYSVRVFDPHLTSKIPASWNRADSLESAASEADLLLLLVDHQEFKSLIPDRLAGMRRQVILDTRNCLDAVGWAEAGFELLRLGVGTTMEPKSGCIGSDGEGRDARYDVYEPMIATG